MVAESGTSPKKTEAEVAPVERWGVLPPLERRPLPPFPGWLPMMGPAVVWIALAAGSGELIWWPRLVAKYGEGFLFLLIPATLLQLPLTYAIGRYTMATGESVWQGFIRLNKWFSLFLWAMMAVQFFWLGGWVTAGSSGLAHLVDFPHSWDQRAKTLFWSWLTIGVLFPTLLFSPRAYRFVEGVMWFISIITFLGLLLACLQPLVLSRLPSFLGGLSWPRFPPFAPLPRPWDPKDTDGLLTSLIFAGLGGFFMLFYSYWVREKGAGMAKYFGHITSPITGKLEVIPLSGFVPAEDAEAPRRWWQWRCYLLADSSIAIVGNIATTLMTCLLAYALLHPKGLVPQGWELVVHQMRFFETIAGKAGRVLFAFIAVAFLSDTWLTSLDAVSRTHTDFLLSFFPPTRRYHPRVWYYTIAVILTVISVVTMHLADPERLIQRTALIGFMGMLLFGGALLWLNYLWLPRHLPASLKPTRLAPLALGFSWVAYLVLGGIYLWLRGR